MCGAHWYGLRNYLRMECDFNSSLYFWNMPAYWFMDADILSATALQYKSSQFTNILHLHLITGYTVACSLELDGLFCIV